MADDLTDDSRILRSHPQGFREQGRSIEAEVDEILQKLPGGWYVDLRMELDSPNRPALELEGLDRTVRCGGEDSKTLVQVDNLIEMTRKGVDHAFLTKKTAFLADGDRMPADLRP